MGKLRSIAIICDLCGYRSRLERRVASGEHLHIICPGCEHVLCTADDCPYLAERNRERPD